MADQAQLNFGGPSDDGYEKWQQELQERCAAHSLKLGLPLGHCVELELECGQVLSGRLRLRGAAQRPALPLDTDLEVDGVPFHPRDVVSCRRID